jgi:hypothetical protein
MIPKASGQNIANLHRHLPASLIPILAACDDGDEDEDNDDDESGDDDGDDGSSGAGGDDDDDGEDDEKSKPEKVKNPEAKRHADDAKKQRLKAKAATERADKATADLKKITDKDKSALELAESNLIAANARIVELEADLSGERDTGRMRTLSHSLSGMFVNDDALEMFIGKCEAAKPDDEGLIDNKAVKAEAEKYLKKHPVFANAGSNEDEGSSTGGSPRNPRRSGSGNASGKKELVKKFPALARRS